MAHSDGGAGNWQHPCQTKVPQGRPGIPFKNEATGEWLDADAKDEKKYKAEETAFVSGIPPYWGGNGIAMVVGVPGDIRMSKAPFSVGDIRTTTWVIEAPDLARLHGSVLRAQHEILQVMSVSTYVRAKKSIMAQISSRRGPIHAASPAPSSSGPAGPRTTYFDTSGSSSAAIALTPIPGPPKSAPPTTPGQDIQYGPENQASELMD